MFLVRGEDMSGVVPSRIICDVVCKGVRAVYKEMRCGRTLSRVLRTVLEVCRVPAKDIPLIPHLRQRRPATCKVLHPLQVVVVIIGCNVEPIICDCDWIPFKDSNARELLPSTDHGRQLFGKQFQIPMWAGDGSAAIWVRHRKAISSLSLQSQPFTLIVDVPKVR